MESEKNIYEKSFEASLDPEKRQ